MEQTVGSAVAPGSRSGASRPSRPPRVRAPPDAAAPDEIESRSATRSARSRRSPRRTAPRSCTSSRTERSTTRQPKTRRWPAPSLAPWPARAASLLLFGLASSAPWLPQQPAGLRFAPEAFATGATRRRHLPVPRRARFRAHRPRGRGGHRRLRSSRARWPASDGSTVAAPRREHLLPRRHARAQSRSRQQCGAASRLAGVATPRRDRRPGVRRVAPSWWESVSSEMAQGYAQHTAPRHDGRRRGPGPRAARRCSSSSTR